MTGLRGVRVLISGGGVAGPSLACWLARYGAETTVVEIAPALRTSGFAVDFRGPTHLGVLSKMGVLEELRDQQTHGGAMQWVDEHGRELFTLPAAFAGGDLEVRRRDLSRVLYERSAESTEYLFGDSVTSATETPRGVRVEFLHSPPRTFDVLIGADGLHSVVRRIAFGPEERHVRHLGYFLAGWEMPNSLGVGSTPQHYNEPGRMVSVAADQRNPDRAVVFAVYASPRLDEDWQAMDQQKARIARALSGMSWHVPELLAGLAPATELYFDSISRVRVPTWSSGRTALLGDAAWGVTLGGMGVGTGIVGSYVLAGELASACGDHRTAFAAYERRMRPYTARWQRGASPGRFLAPATGAGLRLRNAVLSTRVAQKMLIGSTTSMATDVALPAYELIG